MQHESTAEALRICFVHGGQVLQPILAFLVEYFVLHFLQVYGWHDLLRRRLKLVAAAWTLFERIMTKILALRTLFVRRDTTLGRPLIQTPNAILMPRSVGLHVVAKVQDCELLLGLRHPATPAHHLQV